MFFVLPKGVEENAVRFLERLGSWYLALVIMENWGINSLCAVLRAELQRKSEVQEVELGCLGSILSFLSHCLKQLKNILSAYV